MGKVVITMKVLPDSPERKIEELSKKAEAVLAKYGTLYKRQIQPIAFGINAIVLSFVMVEGAIKPEELEVELKKIEGVGDAQLSDVTKLVDVNFG
jgi:elongation factor 1-beta